MIFKIGIFLAQSERNKLFLKEKKISTTRGIFVDNLMARGYDARLTNNKSQKLQNLVTNPFTTGKPSPPSGF